MAKKAKKQELRAYEIRCRQTSEVIVTVMATSEDNAVTRFEDGFIESETEVDVVDFERTGWPRLAPNG